MLKMKREVDFAGFVLSDKGYRISGDITNAISIPSMKTDLRD